MAPARRDRTRSAALLGAGALLGLAGRAAVAARRQRPGTGPTHGGPVPADPAPLPADRLPHDGIDGTHRQLVFLEGGPSDGARVALGWDEHTHRVSDADHGSTTYLDSGRTRPDALGQPARVFVAQ
jgi:hypothetical protein